MDGNLICFYGSVFDCMLTFYYIKKKDGLQKQLVCILYSCSTLWFNNTTYIIQIILIPLKWYASSILPYHNHWVYQVLLCLFHNTNMLLAHPKMSWPVVETIAARNWIHLIHDPFFNTLH